MSRLTAHRCVHCGQPITAESLYVQHGFRMHRNCWRDHENPLPREPKPPPTRGIVTDQTPKPEKPKSQELVQPAKRALSPKPERDVPNSRVQAVPAKGKKR